MSFEDFIDWSDSNQEYKDFYAEWKQRNYSDTAVPFIELITLEKGYVIGNIKFHGRPTSSHSDYEETKKNNRIKWKKIDNNPKLKKYCAWSGALSQYGLTRKDWNKLVLASNGKCMLMGEQFKNASNDCHIDHDHQTGKIRGLICARCNHLLAGLDDKEFNKNAQKYLIKTDYTLSTINSL